MHLITFVSVRPLFKRVQPLKPVIWQMVLANVAPEVLVLEYQLELIVIPQTICASAQRHYLHAPRQKRVTVPIMLANVDQVALVLDYQRVNFVMQETTYVSVPQVSPPVQACQLESTVMLQGIAEMGFVNVLHH